MQAASDHSPSRPAPLGAVLGLTFANSLGTGAVTNGIFFIASQSLGFTRDDNFLLGAVLGLTYIVGAVGVGPVLRRCIARSELVTHRGVLAGLMVALGIACFLPWLAIGESSGGWSIWAFTLFYSPLTGALWPIVESYLAGGRSGRELRRTIGRFNLCWASAIPVAYWGMAPLLASAPLMVLNTLGVFHLLSLVLVWRLPTTPAKHGDTHSERTPEGYPKLLALCRVLLPTSYLVFSVWSPYQPTAISALGVPVAWQTPLAATWHVSRVVVFALLGRAQAWHGRWWLPIAGALAMVLGLIGSISAPGIGPGPTGIGVLILALVAFGGGMGAIYAAALYYAMAVGEAEVDAGGTHEALIGVGYTLGPALGLGVGSLTASHWFPWDDAFRPVLMGCVVGLCALIGAWTAWWVPRQIRAKH